LLGHFHRHGWYEKFHPSGLVSIARLKCTGCGTTHALIPTWSLPQTSHDTAAVERFLTARAAGQTRLAAGQEVLLAGQDYRFLKRLERAWRRCLHNWKALFNCDWPAGANINDFARLEDMDMNGSVLTQANQRALRAGVNAVFNSRCSILLFNRRRAGHTIPHKVDATGSDRPAVDSS